MNILKYKKWIIIALVAIIILVLSLVFQNQMLNVITLIVSFFSSLSKKNKEKEHEAEEKEKVIDEKIKKLNEDIILLEKELNDSNLRLIEEKKNLIKKLEDIKNNKMTTKELLDFLNKI